MVAGFLVLGCVVLEIAPVVGTVFEYICSLAMALTFIEMAHEKVTVALEHAPHPVRPAIGHLPLVDVLVEPPTLFLC